MHSGYESLSGDGSGFEPPQENPGIQLIVRTDGDDPGDQAETARQTVKTRRQWRPLSAQWHAHHPPPLLLPALSQWYLSRLLLISLLTSAPVRGRCVGKHEEGMQRPAKRHDPLANCPQNLGDAFQTRAPEKSALALMPVSAGRADRSACIVMKCLATDFDQR
ncbi:hypothetical protein BaRGS_00000606, partial [Batillaria attramentaria]